MACPAWHPGLTKQEECDLERVQKVAFAIIRGQGYIKYVDSLKYFHSDRRETLCLKFAFKAYKSEKFNSWLSNNETAVNIRSTKLPLHYYHPYKEGC